LNPEFRGKTVRNKVVVFLAVLIALAVVVSFFFNAKTAEKELKKEQTPIAKTGVDAPVVPAAPALPAAATLPAASPTTGPATQPAATQATLPASTLPPATLAAPVASAYKAKGFSQARVATIGSNDKTTGFNLQVELSAWGASILTASTSHYSNEVIHGHPYLVQQYHQGLVYSMPFAARTIYIDNQPVDLTQVRWELKSPAETYRLTLAPEPASTQPGAASAPAPALNNQATYALTILDANDQPVLELTRTWTVTKDSYQILLSQSVKNLSKQAHNIVWQQYGMGDTPQETAYMGDRRLDVVGYFDVGYNPTRQFIYTTGDTITRAYAIEAFNKANRTHALWPLISGPAQAEMVWLAYRNRYFAASVYRPVDPVAPGTQATPVPTVPLKRLDELFPTIGLDVQGIFPPVDINHDTSSVFLTMTSVVLPVAPGATQNLDLAIYTGPLDPKILAGTPYKDLGFGDMIIYSLGGICSFCTFQWLAHFLLNFLYLIHAVTGDWGVAIIVLVLVVRIGLHPITRRSQINMAKMGKQMAAIQPEIEKIKKKYPNDPQAQQAETFKLYSEKNINFLNMFGCAPMFLQMPIWIALYATLYFAIELRHVPAFWGVFQAINPNWHFFADLSSPDRLLVFLPEPKFFNIFILHFDYSALNIMPLLMGVMFIINQKLTAPPATTDTAKQQQKIMLFVTVLFPFMLYSAPSGLTLYIFASTAAGIVDSLIVKQHIAREEAAGTLFKVDPNKKPGFMSKLSQMVQDQQNKLQEKQQNNKKK
jgi:YidC/Oxa1 family membrane protein insertase